MGFRIINNSAFNKKEGYEQCKKDTRVDYKTWKGYYIKDCKINVAEIIYSAVIKDKFIQITYGQLLEFGEDLPLLGDKIRKISMKVYFTGRNPVKEYTELLNDVLYREKSVLLNHVTKEMCNRFEH